MRMLHLLAVLASAAVLVGSDAGNGHAETPQLPGAVPRIALVVKTMANPFFIEMVDGARRAEAEGGIRLLVRAADAETSFEQQIAIVEDMIRQKVDAIVLAPSDSHKLTPVMKKARAAGIALINLDNRLDTVFQRRLGMEPIPYIGVDNVKGAYLAARVLAETMHGPVEAAVIEGVRNAGNAQARKIGALKAFSETPDIRVVAMESADWLADRALDVTKAIFTAHPDVKLLFCANDTMALGAIDFLRHQGIGGVKVAGFDAVAEARKALVSGDLAVTIDQQAAEQGYLGVKAAWAEIKGEPVPAETLIDVTVVTMASGGAQASSITEPSAAAASSKR
jgi:ribose transport system substrate-binding protein